MKPHSNPHASNNNKTQQKSPPSSSMEEASKNKVQSTPVKSNKNAHRSMQSSSQNPMHNVFKLEWTLSRCKKYGKKYTSEAHWASQSPSSYKAAQAHGWIKECLAAATPLRTNEGHYHEKSSQSGQTKSIPHK